MVFNSIHFVGFFLVVYALYRALPHRAQNWMLVAASYYFYAAWDWRFLGLLAGSTVVDFFVARYLWRATDPGRRRWALVGSLAFNLGMLGFFKYFNFFEESLAALFAAVGWQLDFVTLNVLLPIGISFYTFMTISYVIDVYRGDIQPADNFIDFALFVAYFPHLVAGPILRASLLLPQIARPRTIHRTQVVEGLWLVGWGYFQKMFVADNLARLVDTVFGPSATPTGLDVLVATYAFAFQIYGDFAGYSNIARGVSKLMGIELNVNFLFPYFVTSPQEFWRHWHISLSTWLRDYLYIPLGGSRLGPSRRYTNLLITMLLGGLWHGAGWTFVVFGLIHGVALAVNHAWREAGMRALHPVVGWLLTMAVVILGLVFFRAADVPTALSLVASMLGMSALEAMGGAAPAATLASLAAGPGAAVLWIVSLGAIALACPNTQELMSNHWFSSDPQPDAGSSWPSWLTWRPTPAWAAIGAIVLAAALGSISSDAAFLYYQF
jgi:D-alanyl-lipoteichoic acid acyltransferase DltB (MBOAT superfamily)